MSAIAGELISDLYARVERALSRLGVQDHGGDPLAALESWADEEHARCVAAADEHNALVMERGALRCMLTHAVITHPLPWRIEQDWTWEVIAADGTIVAKCQTPAEAQAIVSLAETFRASLAAKEPAR